MQYKDLDNVTQDEITDVLAFVRRFTDVSEDMEHKVRLGQKKPLKTLKRQMRNASKLAYDTYLTLHKMDKGESLGFGSEPTDGFFDI